MTVAMLIPAGRAGDGVCSYRACAITCPGTRFRSPATAAPPRRGPRATELAGARAEGGRPPAEIAAVLLPSKQLDRARILRDTRGTQSERSPAREPRNQQASAT